MKIHTRYMDDWIALYLDGKLVYQSHSIQENHLIELLINEGIISADLETFWDDGVYDLSRYPKTEEELDTKEYKIGD